MGLMTEAMWVARGRGADDALVVMSEDDRLARNLQEEAGFRRTEGEGDCSCVRTSGDCRPSTAASVRRVLRPAGSMAGRRGLSVPSNANRARPPGVRFRSRTGQARSAYAAGRVVDAAGDGAWLAGKAGVRAFISPANESCRALDAGKAGRALAAPHSQLDGGDESAQEISSRARSHLFVRRMPRSR